MKIQITFEQGADGAATCFVDCRVDHIRRCLEWGHPVSQIERMALTAFDAALACAKQMQVASELSDPVEEFRAQTLGEARSRSWRDPEAPKVLGTVISFPTADRPA